MSVLAFWVHLARIVIGYPSLTGNTTCESERGGFEACVLTPALRRKESWYSPGVDFFRPHWDHVTCVYLLYLSNVPHEPGMGSSDSNSVA